MNVETHPERFLDKSDDRPIDEIIPSGSRFDTIAVKRLDDGVEVRAHDTTSDDVVTFTASITDQLFRGVSVDGPQRRRDIDDDLQDALALLGYAVSDPDIKDY
jgi:hypothetical protein